MMVIQILLIIKKLIISNFDTIGASSGNGDDKIRWYYLSDDMIWIA